MDECRCCQTKTQTSRSFGRQHQNVLAVFSCEWICTKTKTPNQPKTPYKTLQITRQPVRLHTSKPPFFHHHLQVFLSNDSPVFLFPLLSTPSFSLSFPPAAFNFKRTTVTLLLIQPLLTNEDVWISFYSLFTLLKV